MIYLTIVPYLLLLAVNEATLFRTWFHLPAWLFVYGWHIVILYVLNRKLVMPLRLFVKEQTMIQPALYYQNAFLSWLLAAGMAGIFSIGLAAYPEITAQTQQNYFVFFVYAAIYALVGMLINLVNIEAKRQSEFPQYGRVCGWLALATPLMALLFLAQVLILFSGLHQVNYSDGWKLLFHSPKMAYVGQLLFGSRLIIWLLISLFSAVLMMGNDAYEQKGFLAAFGRRLALHFALSGLFMLLFTIIMGILSLESSAGWLALIHLNGLLFLLLTSIFFILWKRAKTEAPFEEIHFSDAKHHNLIWTLIAAFFILLSAMQTGGYFAALLMLALTGLLFLKTSFSK
jgi:hypothetical protein